MKTLIAFACSFLFLATARAGTIQTCYAARLYVTLPAEAAGHDLFLNLYDFTGDGVKRHVVAVLTRGSLSVGYALHWPATWEVDLTLPDGEIVASQIAIPNDGCWSATQAPIYTLDLSDAT
jgi:hypothetical protein